MKKVFILLMAALMAVSAMAVELSKEGRAHYNRAMSLLKIATLPEDYKKVAKELEQVVLTDPDYPDTYLQMSRVYRKIGETEGEAYFKKADKCNNTFYQLAPTETDAYLTEWKAIAVDEGTYKGKKAAASMPLLGKWRFAANKRTWYLEVTYDNGKYGLVMNPEFKTTVTRVDDYTFKVQTYWHEKEKGVQEDDCSEDADRGYPTSGVHYYDEWHTTEYEYVKLNGRAPYVETYEQHITHLLRGKITYQETHHNEFYFFNEYLVRY